MGCDCANLGYGSSGLGCLSQDSSCVLEGSGMAPVTPEWATRSWRSAAGDRQTTVSEAPESPAWAARPSSSAAAHHPTTPQSQNPASSPTSKAVLPPRMSARAW